MSKARREELEDVAVRRNLHNHIADLKVIDSFSEDEMPSILRDEYISEYGKLPLIDVIINDICRTEIVL